MLFQGRYLPGHYQVLLSKAGLIYITEPEFFKALILINTWSD